MISFLCKVIEDMLKHTPKAALFLIVAAVLSLAAVPLKAEEKKNLTSSRYSDVLLKAQEKTREGNNREALSLLEPFISDPEKYPVAISDYIVILVWEERFNEAINIYESLPPLFVKRPYVVRNAAKAYYEKREFSKALPLYQRLLDQTPSDSEVQKGVIYCLIQAGDLDAASAYLDKFLTASPDSLPLSLIKAELLFRQNRYSEALKLYRMLAKRDKVDKEFIYKSREDMIAGMPAGKRRALIAGLSQAVQSGEKDTEQDYILTLILNRNYDEAVKIFSGGGIQYYDYLLSWTAWAYFKTGNTGKAKQFYQQILKGRPDYIRANIGLAYCLAEERQYENAVAILDKLLQKEPRNTDVMFAWAFAHEKSGRFLNAVQEYDRILEINPGNGLARRLRILALSDMGASSTALEKAEEEFSSDQKLLDSVKGDMAVHSIRWKEPLNAINILLPQTEKHENPRASLDVVAAFSENEDMKEAVKAYEALVAKGISPPPWVMENAAGAYLYLEHPYKALELYDKALKGRPDTLDTYRTRMGKFYVLQDLRKWEEAKEIIEELDRETPETVKPGNTVRPNWPKADLKLAKGWLLLYEDRLREAEMYFSHLHEKAPANTNFRTGLAYAYLWRGWPRRALREFNISVNMDERDINARTGKVSALNTLAFREQARQETEKLLNAYPKNKNVKALARQLEVEEKREITADFTVSSDDDGVADVRTGLRLTQPLSFYTNVYGFLFHQRTESSQEGLVSYFRRAGLGVNHIFNSSWRLGQQFSVNYDNAEDFGSLTDIIFTPDDHWDFGLSYDSFTTDVPLRARVFDIEADRFRADITYRDSEWRSYRLSHSRMKFSDDNRRVTGQLGYEQGLYVKNDWKMRLFLDMDMSSNSSDDAPYFNPRRDFSISGTHMTENIIKRIYRKAFLQRLYLTLGTYKQSGFSHYATGSARYEHDINFSDTHALRYGVSLGRRVFDGEAVTGYSFYLIWWLML